MTENKELTFVFKQFFMLVLCVSLAAGLCSQPLKSTVSYISSLSETCVNTFTGERAEPVPSEPGQDEPANRKIREMLNRLLRAITFSPNGMYSVCWSVLQALLQPSGRDVGKLDFGNKIRENSVKNGEILTPNTLFRAERHGLLHMKLNKKMFLQQALQPHLRRL